MAQRPAVHYELRRLRGYGNGRLGAAGFEDGVDVRRHLDLDLQGNLQRLHARRAYG